MMKSTSLNSLLEPGSRNAFLSEKPYYTIFAFYIQDTQQSFSILRTLEAATCIYNAPNASTLDWMHHSHGRIKGLAQFRSHCIILGPLGCLSTFSASWKLCFSYTVAPACMVHGCKVNPLTWSIIGWSRTDLAFC